MSASIYPGIWNWLRSVDRSTVMGKAVWEASTKPDGRTHWSPELDNGDAGHWTACGKFEQTQTSDVEKVNCARCCEFVDAFLAL